MKPLKATHEQLKRHNRQLLLRAIYSGLADNRAALAQETGLAKPTVSDLIAELMEEGLVVESGRGQSTEGGGKRPTLIKFVPDARQVIGVSLDGAQMFGVLSNLAGQVVAQHYADPTGARGEEAVTLLTEVVNGLVAQLDAPLLCIGVGVPGVVESGVVEQSGVLDWSGLPLAARLKGHYEVPVYIGNSTELAALAQFAFGLNGDDRTRNLVTLRVNNTVEVGITLEGAAYHQGGDIGCLRQDAGRIDALLGWDATQERAAELRRAHRATQLPETNLTYMDIRYHAAQGDAVALQLCDELSTHLAQIIGWVIGLLRPDHISLAGPIVDLGDSFLRTAAHKAESVLTPDMVQPVVFSLAYSADLSAAGAVALALQRELDIL